LIFGYTGKMLDEATGLQNNLNRWYDSQTGRWVSQDPIGFGGGDANLYRYVGNHPSQSTDPSGLVDPLKAKNPPRSILTPNGFQRRVQVGQDGIIAYTKTVFIVDADTFEYESKYYDLAESRAEEIIDCDKDGFFGVDEPNQQYLKKHSKKLIFRDKDIKTGSLVEVRFTPDSLAKSIYAGVDLAETFVNPAHEWWQDNSGPNGITNILNHEQGHVNVTEVLARALIAELRSISIFVETEHGKEAACVAQAQARLANFAKARQESLMVKLNQLHSNYDSRAGSPDLVSGQSEWDSFFQSVFDSPVPSNSPIPLGPPKQQRRSSR